MRVYGIRHHGPGSAASLRAALRAQAPDCILIEGPPDGDGLLAIAGLVLPVALLLYPETQERAAFYPFAIFSPEWVALRYAHEHGIPARFCDLPQAHQMAHSWPREEIPIDPIQELGGGADGGSGSSNSRATTTSLTPSARPWASCAWELTAQGREALREAWMRRTIRQEMKAGRREIAVVCGACMSALLQGGWPSAKEDEALLKGLPKVKVNATWIPWTYYCWRSEWLRGGD